MKLRLWLLSLGLLCAACGGAPTPEIVPPTLTVPPTIVSATGYRPLQAGDVVEGALIDYQYVVPSLDQPVVTIAFSTNLFQLLQISPELSGGLVEYVRQIAKSPAVILGFEESAPGQTEAKPVTIDFGKPIEIAFIQIVNGTHYWSVAEIGEGGVQAAYKIVRRKDGGLRFIDAYGLNALYSASNLITLNGGGTGLVFSSRLALLHLILKDTRYQKGTDVFVTHPVDLALYDSRILKLDPTRTGLAQDRDWVLISRPVPNPGLLGP